VFSVNRIHILLAARAVYNEPTILPAKAHSKLQQLTRLSGLVGNKTNSTSLLNAQWETRTYTTYTRQPFSFCVMMD